jgi:hypothetical protein
MMNVLGPRMVMMIFLGAVLLLVGGGGSFYYLDPLLTQVTADLNVTEARVREKNSQISQIKQDLLVLKDQIVVYNTLKDKLFFEKQDHSMARAMIIDLVKIADMREASVTISAPTVLDSQEAMSADHALISGPLLLKLDSVTDMDIYRFTLALEKLFPGRLEFRGINLARTKSPDAQAMEDIRAKGVSPFVHGEVEYSWLSMVPKADAVGLKGAPVR